MHTIFVRYVHIYPTVSYNIGKVKEILSKYLTNQISYKYLVMCLNMCKIIL
jgi:hypothetical protein